MALDMLFIVSPILKVCKCSIICCTFLYVNSSFAIILIGKRGLVALLSLSSWCPVIDAWPFLALPWVYLQFVIVVFSGYTHLLFLYVQFQYLTSTLLRGCENL